MNGAKRKKKRKKGRPEIRQEDLQGFKYFKLLKRLLERLHDDATQRDRAHNRKLFFDQYASLILFYFFNPILTSLRGIQQASQLEKVQQALDCACASLGTLSEASRVFDPTLLEEIIAELAAQAIPHARGPEAELLKGLIAVDGSLLPALAKMTWALWLDDDHRAAKLHLHFEVFKDVPCRATVTDANTSEKQVMRAMLEAGRWYVFDRGYAEYQLFQDIIDADSSFVGRIRNNADWTLIQERPISDAARQAGVRRDWVVRLGGPQSGKVLKQPLRVVEVVTTNRDGETVVLLLATDRLDLDAELIALAYRYRWRVELFFRWLKCVLGCRHLLSTSENGVRIQVYLALIASLLISLWTGRKPNKRTFEMLCLYFLGWASESELMAHLENLPEVPAEGQS